MYTDRNALDEYAYHGVFYRSEQKPKEDGDLIGNDGDMLGDTDTSADESETENVETIIFETKYFDIAVGQEQYDKSVNGLMIYNESCKSIRVNFVHVHK